MMRWLIGKGCVWFDFNGIEGVGFGWVVYCDGRVV